MLRRRIIWMTGQWINVKFSRLTRPILYQVLLQVMGAQEDLVVCTYKMKHIVNKVSNEGVAVGV